MDFAAAQQGRQLFMGIEPFAIDINAVVGDESTGSNEELPVVPSELSGLGSHLLDPSLKF